LAAAFTVNTMPEGTVKAFAGHGGIGDILPADGRDCEDVLAQLAKAGIDIDMRWRQNCETMAPNRSAILGRTDEDHFGQEPGTARASWNSIEALP
jgi:hypothetical protein